MGGSAFPIVSPAGGNTYSPPGDEGQLAYGRIWKITVTGADGKEFVCTSSDFGQEACRATFFIDKSGHQEFWFCDVMVYNLDTALMYTILNEQGLKVKIQAGYSPPPGQSAEPPLLFKTFVYQTWIERINVVDYVLILHCITGVRDMVVNNVNKTYDPDITQEQWILKMGRDAPRQLSIKYLEHSLGKTPLPRGRVVCADPQYCLNMVARENSQFWWYNGEDVVITNFEESDPNVIVYTPHTGLIGTPIQTQEGIDFRVLLDPRLNVLLKPKLVQIKNALIQGFQAAPSPGNYPPIVPPDGIYAVAGVKHYGDTRGNEWYTDVQAVTTIGGKLAMMGAAANAPPTQQDCDSRGCGFNGELGDQ